MKKNMSRKYTNTYIDTQRERERERELYIYQCHSQREGHQSQQRKLDEEYKGLSMLEKSIL